MEKNNLEKAYSVIDSILQEICLSEELVIQTICSLIEEENIKFNSPIIMETILVLKQWNEIPVNEIKAKIEKIVQSKNKA